MAPHWQLPSISPEEVDAVSTLLMIGGFGTTFFAYRYSKSFVIGIGGLLFGLFLWNEVVPQFGEYYNDAANSLAAILLDESALPC
jgi:hypothetical protein